uniref:Uncharacterized protein n=1 Tax=Panagrolaimus davidi TaxID=227884 RepID=A0A914PI18_9BILA
MGVGRPIDEWCYYCEKRHRQAECKRYKTEKSREMVAKKKNMCHLCFVKSDKIHSPENKECPTNETCFSWYSTDHHSVFCPTRIEELKKGIFLPKIDDNLLARFVETLEIDEKYLLATSSDLAQNIVPLKEIKIVDKIRKRHESLEDYESSTFVVTSYLWIRQDDMIKKFLKEQIICKSRYVILSNFGIPAKQFLQMFSSITKEISLYETESEVTFSDIIKRVPNIEVFEIRNSNLKANGETWIKDLMKFKKGKNFRELCISLNTIEFDIEILKEFILTKCVHNVLITIFYDANLSVVGINNFIDKIGNGFFEEEPQSFRRKPHILIYGRNFTLDIEQPKRANRKRKIDSQ